MNHDITVELQFFLTSVLWGGIVLLAYDGLRIIRRLIKHGTFFLAFEDLIFWITASVFIFSMIYKQNSGIIRGFSVMGMTIGMVLYHYIFKNYVVNIIVKGIHILLRPITLAIKAVKKMMHFIILKVKKVVDFLIRQLKKLLKSVKITVNKRRQALAVKMRKRIDWKAALKKNKKRKPDNKETWKQTEPETRKEPVPKFARVNPEEIRHKNEAMQKTEPVLKSVLAKQVRAKHRI